MQSRRQKLDPDKKNVIVYDLEHDMSPVIYGAEESVPVGIWNGECTVDFKMIYERIAFLSE